VVSVFLARIGTQHYNILIFFNNKLEERNNLIIIGPDDGFGKDDFWEK